MLIKAILIVLLLTFSQSVFGQIPSDSLSIYYPFNGSSTDESGNEINATIYGATLVPDRNSNVNSAFYFNGGSDYMEVPYSPLLQVDFPFSVSIWVNIESFSDVTQVLFTNDEFENAYSGFSILYNSFGRVSATYGDGDGIAPEYRKTKHSNILLELNTWHHIVASFNSLDEINLYIDCEADDGYYSGTASSMNLSGSSGVIGRDLGSHFNSYHNGAIDDFRMYRKSLNSDEALSLCLEDAPLSVEDLYPDNLNIKISQNPSNGPFKISINDDVNFKNASIQVFNISGQIVDYKNFTNQSVILETQNWGSSGLYFGQISDANGKPLKHIKLIVQ